MVSKEMTRTFEEARASRNSKYPGGWASAQQDAPEIDAVVTTLNADGFAFLPGLIPSDQIGRTRAKMDGFIRGGTNVSRARKVLVDAPWTPVSKTEYLTPDDLAKGSDHYREQVNYVDIKDPLVAIPELLPVAFHDSILNAAERYLGGCPGIGFVKMRRSYANSLPDFDTNFFHFDGNSAKLLKAFVYLNDVDLDGGPITYVQGSHVDRFPGWSIEDRYTYEDIQAAYGDERIAFPNLPRAQAT